MARSKIAALTLFGLTLIAVGGIWMVFNEGFLISLISKFWLTNSSSPTYWHMELMLRGWHVTPIIVFVVGIVALIVSGMSSTDISEV